MSSSGGPTAGGLSRPSAGLLREDASLERRGEAAAALWVALAARVQAPPPAVLPTGDAEPPNAWRGSAGDLTPGGGAIGGSAGAAAGDQAPERLTLRVDGGHLGELSLTLDRENGALRVIIGLENERFIGAVAPDARALRAALEGAGLSVHALDIVRSADVGTVLAQRRASPSGQKQPTAPTGSEGREPETQKRNQKRLMLIG